DVQPAAPLDAWTTPPFQPRIRGHDLFGRGAADDKGQVWTHIKAIEACLKTRGTLPVNVLCLFEGEEEMGSKHLLATIARVGPSLHADVALISDMTMRSERVPAIIYALRGACSMELEVHGPAHEIHSGHFGGAVANPLHALSTILSSLHDSTGRVAIQGFYGRVAASDPGERAYLARVGPAAHELEHAAAAPVTHGERGYSPYERIALRPALSVNGIRGGYQGPGVKAVIPASAYAKISFRLVPHQDPEEIEALAHRHFLQHAPPGVRLVVRSGVRARPALIDRTQPALHAAAQALQQSFGVQPVFLRSGGTIPVVSALVDDLRIPAPLIGFARPGDRVHSPDERFHLPHLFRGINTSIRLLAQLGRLPPSSLATRLSEEGTST
ncbi:MAG: M20/M25/M40 family metallo-hydrolase, partial [Longimicrobiales bacterium]